MPKIEEVKVGVQTGKTKLVAGLVQEALDEGAAPMEILQAMIDGMDVVGDKFSKGEIFIPEMLIAAKAMSKGVDVLKPQLTEGGAASLGTCVIGTVKGDLHDIGKNLVAMMLESAGFNMVDLGVDVSSEKFLQAIKDHDEVKLVACSSLLSTTMPALRDTVDTLKKSGLDGFSVLVGGAPITQEFADKIGADAYAPDAGSAAKKGKALVKAG